KAGYKIKVLTARRVRYSPPMCVYDWEQLRCSPEVVMSTSPETRASLLLRLKDQADDEAWFEFTEIYRPVIQRLASRRGMQPADAADLVKQVLSSVACVISRWQADPARARFRTWLGRVATNAIINALTRGRPDRGSGDSGLHAVLDAQPAVDVAESELVR